MDDVAARGRMERLQHAFQQPEPLDALAEFIRVFCGFWESDRVGIRRMRGWALLERESGEDVHGRDAWRREGLEVIVGRVRERHGVPEEDAMADTVDLRVLGVKH